MSNSVIYVYSISAVFATAIKEQERKVLERMKDGFGLFAPLDVTYTGKDYILVQTMVKYGWMDDDD